MRFRDTTRKAAREAGEKTYAGIACAKGHDGTRYVASKKCVRCQYERGVEMRKRFPTRARDYSAKWRKSHPDEHRAHGRKWVENNRDRHNAAGLDWHYRNPEHSRVNQRNRRARIAAAPGMHTRDDIAAIMKAQRHKCAYCKISLKGRKHDVDHIVAITRGGANDRSNLQILCVRCNRSKNNRDPIQFARERGMLL